MSSPTVKESRVRISTRLCWFPPKTAAVTWSSCHQDAKPLPRRASASAAVERSPAATAEAEVPVAERDRAMAELGLERELEMAEQALDQETAELERELVATAEELVAMAEEAETEEAVVMEENKP